MTLNTVDIDAQKKKIEEKRRKINGLYLYHKSVLDILGVHEKQFIPKLPYADSRGEMVVGLFLSEINRGTDIYIEFADPDYNVDQYDRKLYKYVHNPHFADEYERVVPNERYLVPVMELDEVLPNLKPLKKDEEVQGDLFSGGETDLPFSEMTIRDYMAIHTGAPVSNKPWLNELVTKHINK